MGERHLDIGGAVKKTFKGGARIGAAGTIGFLAAQFSADNGPVYSNNTNDSLAKNTLNLDKPHSDYDRIVTAETTNSPETQQTNTKVNCYLEVPDDQLANQADLEACRQILTNVQAQLYQEIGATFNLGNVRFVKRPEHVYYPKNLKDFFENSSYSRTGAYVRESGLGGFCDKDINPRDFWYTALIGWRNQRIGSTGNGKGDHNLLTATCLKPEDGLGGALVSEDHLDNMSLQESERRLKWLITAVALKDLALSVRDFNGTFTPEQITLLQNHPLFTVKNPDWNPETVIQLEEGWNLEQLKPSKCTPSKDAFASISHALIVAWHKQNLNDPQENWKGYVPDVPDIVNDYKEVCPPTGPEDMVWILLTEPVELKLR